jgi:D-glycero-alpha-D-manno-heptose 1-phosphate guanylyltransferase
MINECIILAGGLGTRLRSVISDMPKCLAPVSGKPFLTYVINHLKKKGIENFIFAVGYKSEVIEKYLQKEFATINYQLSIEQEPLGTGGAIKLACSKATQTNILVLNGDTFFAIDVIKLTGFHNRCNASCTLSLKPMQNFDRYGVVELNEDYSIRSFNEKQFYETGLINGGVYALDAEKFMKESLPEKFSFEEYLEKSVSLSRTNKRRMYGVVQDKYFIDIGIPEDYERAQIELPQNS